MIDKTEHDLIELNKESILNYIQNSFSDLKLTDSFIQQFTQTLCEKIRELLVEGKPSNQTIFTHSIIRLIANNLMLNNTRSLGPQTLAEDIIKQYKSHVDLCRNFTSELLKNKPKSVPTSPRSSLSNSFGFFTSSLSLNKKNKDKRMLPSNDRISDLMEEPKTKENMRLQMRRQHSRSLDLDQGIVHKSYQ